MKTKISGILFVFCSFLLCADRSLCLAACTITLSNGNVIQANSYVIKGGKAYLKYPVGEAVIPASRVVSIRSNDGDMVLLQSKGTFFERPEPKASQGAAGPASVTAAAPEIKPAPAAHMPKDRDKQSEKDRKGKQKTAPSLGLSARGSANGGSVFGGVSGTAGGNDDPRLAAIIDQSLSATDDAQQAQIEKALENIIEGDDSAGP